MKPVFNDVRIVLKKKGEDELLYQSLLKQGYDVQQVSGSIVVLLPKGERAVLPQGMDSFITMLNAQEQGGHQLKGTNGSSVIICGISGKKIKPFYIPGTREYLKPHAYFSIPKALVRIEATNANVVSIIYYEAVVVPHNKVIGSTGYVELRSTILWVGNAKKDATMLPARYEKYAPAVRAAIKKANCKDCKEVHFAEL